MLNELAANTALRCDREVVPQDERHPRGATAVRIGRSRGRTETHMGLGWYIERDVRGGSALDLLAT